MQQILRLIYKWALDRSQNSEDILADWQHPNCMCHLYSCRSYGPRHCLYRSTSLLSNGKQYAKIQHLNIDKLKCIHSINQSNIYLLTYLVFRILEFLNGFLSVYSNKVNLQIIGILAWQLIQVKGGTNRNMYKTETCAQWTSVNFNFEKFRQTFQDTDPFNCFICKAHCINKQSVIL